MLQFWIKYSQFRQSNLIYFIIFFSSLYFLPSYPHLMFDVDIFAFHLLSSLHVPSSIFLHLYTACKGTYETCIVVLLRIPRFVGSLVTVHMHVPCSLLHGTQFPFGWIQRKIIETKRGERTKKILLTWNFEWESHSTTTTSNNRTTRHEHAQRQTHEWLSCLCEYNETQFLLPRPPARKKCHYLCWAENAISCVAVCVYIFYFLIMICWLYEACSCWCWCFPYRTSLSLNHKLFAENKKTKLKNRQRKKQTDLKHDIASYLRCWDRFSSWLYSSL